MHPCTYIPGQGLRGRPRPTRRVARTLVSRTAAVALVAAAACAADTPPGSSNGEPYGSAWDSASAAISAGGAVSAIDDAGLRVTLPRPARRIVSLIPSATETIIALGAAEQIVGRTRYDVAPEIAARPVVGGTLDPSIEAILELRPDLVVTWEHDKRQLTRRRLSALGVPTFSLRSVDTSDVFRGIARLGRLVGRDSAAAARAATLRDELATVRASVEGRPRPSVFFVVFNDPPMTAGPRTFVAQLIETAGGRTIFPEVRQDWPTVALEEVVRRQPDVVVLPFGENGAVTLERLRSTAGWRELAAVKHDRIIVVPANLLNRPGPYIAEAARALRDALHPDARRGPR